MRLDQLAKNGVARIVRIDWGAMDSAEGQRLREFGVCEGASVELLHRGGLFRPGVVACRVGRMTVAMRAAHARAIEVGALAEAGQEALLSA